MYLCLYFPAISNQGIKTICQTSRIFCVFLDDEAALTPVEIPCTESEVDLAEILGPANDEHEEGIKQQEQYDFARRDLMEERTSDDIVETAVKTHFRGK